MSRNEATGPNISAGIFGFPGAIVGNPDAGPDISYQGDAFIDPRFPVQNGAAAGVYSYLINNQYLAVDCVPSASSASSLASQQTLTSGTAMTLAGSGSPVARIIVTNPGAGYTSAPTVVFTGTSSTTAIATAVMLNGQIAAINLTTNGTGYTAAPTISFTGGGTATTTATATAYLAMQPITSVQPWGTGTQSAVTVTGIALDGPMVPLTPSAAHNIFDPRLALARAISITSTTSSDTSWTFAIRGYDLYGIAMTETITLSSGGTAWGKKAWKYITSITPTNSSGQTTTTGSISAGTLDIIGLPTYTPNGEYVTGSWAGTYISATTGFTAPVTTSATATTGDTRGTYTLQSASSDGTRRLMLNLTLGTTQQLGGTPHATGQFAGATQA